MTIPTRRGIGFHSAEQVRSRAEIPTTTVGLIASQRVRKVEIPVPPTPLEIGRARRFVIRWPLRAAHKLSIPTEDAPYQPQYVRGAYY